MITQDIEILFGEWDFPPHVLRLIECKSDVFNAYWGFINLFFSIPEKISSLQCGYISVPVTNPA